MLAIDVMQMFEYKVNVWEVISELNKFELT